MAWQSMSAALVPSNLCGLMYVSNRCYFFFSNLHEKVIYDIETSMANHLVWLPHDFNGKVELFCSDVFVKVELVSSDLETCLCIHHWGVDVICDMNACCVCIHGML